MGCDDMNGSVTEARVLPAGYTMARHRHTPRGPGRGRIGMMAMGDVARVAVTGESNSVTPDDDEGTGGAVGVLEAMLRDVRASAPPSAPPSRAPSPRPECGGCRAGIVITTRNDLIHAERCPACTSCSCGGVGYVFSTDSEGYRSSKPCHCVAGDKAIERINAGRFNSRHCGDWAALAALAKAKGLDGWSAQSAMQAVHHWVSTYQPGQRGWWLHGPVGTLKSGLATVAGVELAFCGRRVRFANCRRLWAEANRRMKEAGGAHGRDALVAELVRNDVVILDDITRTKGERHTNWIEEIVDRLYEAVTTVICTSNYAPRPRLGSDPNTLYVDDVLSAPTASRLREMCETREMAGPDSRVMIADAADGTRGQGQSRGKGRKR